MIQETSRDAYKEIMKALPEACRPVYAFIFNNPGVCIGEIGKALNMQNSSVSGRVNDLIADKLAHYIVDDEGKAVKKMSPVSKKAVMMLRANDVFTVNPSQIKRQVQAVSLRSLPMAAPDAYKLQNELWGAA